MFHRFRAKINYAVSIAASGMVLIYMIVIFLLYSGFLRQDYLQKVIHTGSILSQSIEAHLSNIEEAALLFSVPSNEESEVFDFHTALYQAFRDMLSSNAELSSLIFVTESDSYYYYTTDYARDGLEEVISRIQENFHTGLPENSWQCISVKNASSHSCELVYIHLVRDADDIPAGYLILFPSSSVFTESLEPLQAIYHDNLSAGLRFDDDSFLPIQSGQRAVQSGFPEALSFRMTEYSWSDSRFVYISIPLENFNLCFQASIYLQPLFQKQLIIAACLLDIFLITLFCVIILIRIYTGNLVSRMEKLSQKLDDYSPENQEGDIS